MTRQIFGYTPATPAQGQVGYVQLHMQDPANAFGNGAPYQVIVRDHASSHDADMSTAHCPITLEGLRDLQHQISLELAAVGGSAAAEIHPAPVEFTEEELRANPILRYFHYSHLPPHLQERSRPFAAQARLIMDTAPACAERTAGLRKLLECKDCIVRAFV